MKDIEMKERKKGRILKRKRKSLSLYKDQTRDHVKIKSLILIAYQKKVCMGICNTYIEN